MTDWTTRATRRAYTLLWSVAALLVLGVHAGAVAWMLREPPIAPADSPPAAIMLELAELAAAPEVEEELDLPPDQLMQEQMASEPVEEVKEETEEEPEKVEDVVEEIEEELPEVEETPVEKVEVPVPKARPKKIEKKQKPKPAAAPVPKTAAPKKVEAPRAQTAKAAQSSRGVSSVSPARWQARLLGHLERHKRYPPGANGATGIVGLVFSIDSAGNVTSARISRSSGHAALDQEVLALVRRASPVPAPPPGAPHKISVPVRFNTR